MGSSFSQSTRYSSVAIWLHWLIAAALAGQIALGHAMPRDASGFALFQLHKSIGIAILVLSIARLAWRLTHKRPAPIEGGMTGFLASAVHWGFYTFMILAPLTGWAIVSTAPINIPTILFGVIPLPHLPIGGDDEFWEGAHEILSNAALALFVLHVAGALRHHFLKRDGLLGRMAPGGKAGVALLLGAAVIAVWALVPVLIGPGGGSDNDGDDKAEVGTAVAVDPLGVATETATEDAAVPETDATEAAAAEEAPEEAAEAAPPPDWTITPGGTLRFAIDNGGTAIQGSFARWNGDIAFDPADPSTAAIVIRIELASASLGDATQDTMLQGDNFFSTAANPTATWRSTRVTSLGGNRYRAEGTLSLKGARQPQAITFNLAGTGNRRRATGSATIDRNAFAVGTGQDASGLAGSVQLDFAFDARY